MKESKHNIGDLVIVTYDDTYHHNQMYINYSMEETWGIITEIDEHPAYPTVYYVWCHRFGTLDQHWLNEGDMIDVM
jgi:hypothetical protein